MHTASTLLSWVLAAAPEASTQTEPPDLELARVEMIDTGDIQLVAYEYVGPKPPEEWC